MGKLTAADPRQIAGRLPDDERGALLSLVGEGDRATVLIETADRLQEHGLATVAPDGHMDLSDLGHRVLEVLRREQPSS